MDVAQTVVVDDATAILDSLLDLVWSRCVEIVLVALTCVVVDTHLRVEGHQFLALCYHAEDAADDDRRASVDVDVAAEDLGEVLRHTLADAVMLTFAQLSEVAEAVFALVVERADEIKSLLAVGCQFAVVVGLSEDVDRVGEVALADEPTRAVAAVVAEVEGFVALGGWGQLVVSFGDDVGCVVACGAVEVLLDLLFHALSAGRGAQ